MLLILYNKKIKPCNCVAGGIFTNDSSSTFTKGIVIRYGIPPKYHIIINTTYSKYNSCILPVLMLHIKTVPIVTSFNFKFNCENGDKSLPESGCTFLIRW